MTASLLPFTAKFTRRAVCTHSIHQPAIHCPGHRNLETWQLFSLDCPLRGHQKPLPFKPNGLTNFICLICQNWSFFLKHSPSWFCQHYPWLILKPTFSSNLPHSSIMLFLRVPSLVPFLYNGAETILFVVPFLNASIRNGIFARVKITLTITHALWKGMFSDIWKHIHVYHPMYLITLGKHPNLHGAVD